MNMRKPMAMAFATLLAIGVCPQAEAFTISIKQTLGSIAGGALAAYVAVNQLIPSRPHYCDYSGPIGRMVESLEQFALGGFVFTLTTAAVLTGCAVYNSCKKENPKKQLPGCKLIIRAQSI